jgi:ABC-type lipoprotein export system ATPase subunit
MRWFNREHGQTILLVTHDPEVGEACDRVVHMRDGLVADHEAAPVPTAVNAVPPTAIPSAA